jgi:hypothetical protein
MILRTVKEQRNQDADTMNTAVGVTFTSTATGAATAVATNQQTLTLTSAGTTSTFVTIPVATTATTHPKTHRKGGLGTGAKAGIAVGAVAIVLMAAVIAFFLFRKKRKPKQEHYPQQTQIYSQPVQPNPNYAPVEQQIQTNPNLHETDGTEKPYSYTEIKPVSATTAPTVLPTTLANFQQNKEPVTPVSLASTAVQPSPVQQAGQGHGYEYHGQYPLVPELSEDPAIVTSPWNQDAYELDHSVQRTEIGSGVERSEADSRIFNPAQESSVPPSSINTESVVPVARSAQKGGPEDDADLERMKNEIESLRLEKERIRSLQALEERERELSRKIVERELAKRS